MTQADDCRGMMVDPGVWYCAPHGTFYFSAPQMLEQKRHGKRLLGLAAAEAWMNRRAWPLTTLPANAVLYTNASVRLAMADDFANLVEMLRWMDERHLRGEGR